MGIRILEVGDRAVMFCSTTDWAFGPVFYADNEHEAEERLEMFLDWLSPHDARNYPDKELQAKYSEFLSIEKGLWAAKLRAEIEDDEYDKPEEE